MLDKCVHGLVLSGPCEACSPPASAPAEPSGSMSGCLPGACYHDTKCISPELPVRQSAESAVQPGQVDGLEALWDGSVTLADDHQRLALIRDGDMLRRVIVCCDCGLVHKMSVDTKRENAYFVREDGPPAERIRQRGRAEGHRFALLDALSASERRAEQWKDAEHLQAKERQAAERRSLKRWEMIRDLRRELARLREAK